jgi:hypothetical protein
LNDQLDYRDGHEQTDVAPVLVDRLAHGMRVVVRYPRDVRVRTRNRFLITLAIVIAWPFIALRLIMRPWAPWLGVIGAGWWPLGPAAVVVMGLMWAQAHRWYVLEADRRRLVLEIHGLIFKARRRELARESIRDIRLEKNRRGRAVAITIVTKVRSRTLRLFDDMDERHLLIIADALREGLGMPLIAAAKEV